MCNKQNIKVTEGNAFALLLPLKARTYTADGVPVDEDLNPQDLTDVVVKIGDTAYTYTLEDTGVQVVVPGTLKRGTYDVVLTGKHEGADIRAAWFELLTIVAWNYQSDVEQFLPGSPIIAPAAVIVSGALTDAELEALKEEYRERNAQLAQAIADAEAAKEHYDELAEQLTGVAQEQTLTDGVTAIREDISHIDIDTSTLAKEETLGTPAAGQPSTIFEAIAAIGGNDDAKQTIVDAINAMGGSATMSMTWAQLASQIEQLYVLSSGIVFANEVVLPFDALQFLQYSAAARPIVKILNTTATSLPSFTDTSSVLMVSPPAKVPFAD